MNGPVGWLGDTDMCGQGLHLVRPPNVLPRRRWLGRIHQFLPALFLVLAPPGAAVAQDACLNDHYACPTLVGPDSLWLEPSGLAWLPRHQILIGVTDDVGRARGHELFYILGEDLGLNEIPVHPLLSPEQSHAVEVQDLEGLTSIPGTDTLYAIASLSLDKFPERADDRWNRHQLLRVVVEEGDKRTFKARVVERVSSHRRPDFREWVISSSGRDWGPEAFRGRPESGGINVEGLATDPAGNLLVGFRGPMDGGQALVLRVRPAGPEEQPRPLGWLTLDMSRLPVTTGDPWELERGIRGMDRIPASDSEGESYVVLVGHSGPRFDPLRIVYWNADKGVVCDLAELPDSFVGEGIAVMGVGPEGIRVVVVSDKDAKVMIRSLPVPTGESGIEKLSP